MFKKKQDGIIEIHEPEKIPKEELGPVFKGFFSLVGKSRPQAKPAITDSIVSVKKEDFEALTNKDLSN
jgi:hypothetical protein